MLPSPERRGKGYAGGSRDHLLPFGDAAGGGKPQGRAITNQKSTHLKILQRSSPARKGGHGGKRGAVGPRKQARGLYLQEGSSYRRREKKRGSTEEESHQQILIKRQKGLKNRQPS